MSSNTLPVIDHICREAQRVAHEELSFLKNVNRQYDAQFKDNGQGAKGASIRIREPARYTVTTGAKMDTQDMEQTSQTLTVATQKHVGMSITSAEMAQDIVELSKNHIQPAVKALVADVENDCIKALTKGVANVVGAGSFTAAGGFAPGTDLTSLLAPGRARARLNQMAAPKSDRCIVANSENMATMVNGVAGYFNPSNAISEQYTEGMIARTAMADWYENDKVWTMTNTGDVAGAINNGTLTSGITTLTVDGFTAAPTEGMVFTVADVYDVHPETKEAYPHLKQFTVTSATTTSITFTPAMNYDTTEGKQNCSGTPVNDAAVTFYGSASTAYDQNIMFHKDAFTFVTADLPLMGGADKCARRVQDGLSLRVWQDGDIRNDELLLRIDILYGRKTIRPDWACRISN